jgi:hypothetical protein
MISFVGRYGPLVPTQVLFSDSALGNLGGIEAMNTTGLPGGSLCYLLQRRAHPFARLPDSLSANPATEQQEKESFV